MSAPVSDDDNSNHQMYAPKSLRERTSIPRTPQLRVDSPRISPSQPQDDPQAEYGSAYSEEENAANDGIRAKASPCRNAEDFPR